MHVAESTPRRPARLSVSTRLSKAGVEVIDKIAEEAHVSRSDVTRALLAEALSSAPVLAAARKRLTGGL